MKVEKSHMDYENTIKTYQRRLTMGLFFTYAFMGAGLVCGALGGMLLLGLALAIISAICE